MKQSSKTIILEFETTLLFDEDLDGANNIRNIKLITLVTLKSSLSNEM